MAECGVKASRRTVPEIPDRDRRGDDGKRADAVTFMNSPVLRHPTLGDESVVTFDTTIVHAFQANHTFLADAVGAAEPRKYAKYLDAYGRQGAAFVPLASSSIGELGADLLRLLWICAAMAVHAAEVRDEGGAVPEAAHGPRPGPLDWKTRRGLLFQSMKNRYLVATYEAVVHRILGRYMGLRRDPKFLQALDAVRPAWAPEPVSELLEEGGLVEDGASVVGVVAIASVARGRCVQRGASLGSSVSVGLGVASLGAAALVGQAPSEAVRQTTAGLLVAQLQVVTGRPGVYMMYPGPAANGVVVGGPPVGAPLGMGGGSALGGVDSLLGPALDPGLGPDLGLGPAGRVVGV
jgi:hypothetical protein